MSLGFKRFKRFKRFKGFKMFKRFKRFKRFKTSILFSYLISNYFGSGICSLIGLHWRQSIPIFPSGLRSGLVLLWDFFRVCPAY